jgi:biotin operon repressor
MLETSARLLRLLSLLQARRDWTSAELAARLGVTTRTVRNDVDRLRRLGYPVDARPGVAGGYRLGAGGALPPLLLDDDEAVAVAIGLRTAASGSITGIEEASVRALGKLQQTRGRLPIPVDVEPVGEERCAFEPGSDDPGMLALYLGMLGADFTIVDAPELVAALRELTGRYQRAIDTSCGHPARSAE